MNNRKVKVIPYQMFLGWENYSSFYPHDKSWRSYNHRRVDIFERIILNFNNYFVHRLSEYPNRIRLFLRLPRVTFRGQNPIRHYPYWLFLNIGQISRKFLGIRRKCSTFWASESDYLKNIRTNPNPTFCYPTISISDFLISAPPLTRRCILHQTVESKHIVITDLHLKSMPSWGYGSNSFWLT